MSKLSKTNAMRLLDREQIQYDITSYETGDGLVDGISCAHKLGVDPREVYKTLVLKANNGEFFVGILPVNKELDLKAMAAAAQVKSIQPIPLKELKPLTGYERGGCSPIGMKKQLSTIVDSAALSEERIYVSAGRIGTQVHLSPRDLIDMTRATTANISKQEEDHEGFYGDHT